MGLPPEPGAEYAPTNEREAKIGIDTLPIAMIVLALGAATFCVALTIHCYMPCPWLDEWRVIADMAKGTKPWSWGWLWSQHSEHRIAVTRLLIWLDWALFGGKTVSLFIEMYA